MAGLRNCPKCGRVFAYVGRGICPRCLEQEEEDFKLVRTYIRENPGATIIEVSEATEIDEQTILRFLKEGRLVSRGLSASITLECERCGQSIESGRHCQKCLKELERQFQDTLSAGRSPKQAQPSRDREGIHIMRNWKKDR